MATEPPNRRSVTGSGLILSLPPFLVHSPRIPRVNETTGWPIQPEDVMVGASEHPQTLDEAIEALSAIVQWAKDAENRIGFFATMYRTVTVQVRAGVEADLFEDGPRMERLAITFANRYLEAVDQFRAGKEPSGCWDLAFESAEKWRPLIIQHLLLGINAHINLDLGIAAAQTAPGDDLQALREDFVAINDLLARQVAKVRADIGEMSPWLGLLDRVDPTAGRAVINFSIERAREQAWTAAELLTCIPDERKPGRIDVFDRNAMVLARLVLDPPGWILKFGLRVIRLREMKNVQRVIEKLEKN